MPQDQTNRNRLKEVFKALWLRADIDIDLRESQAVCELIDLETCPHAALQHNFRTFPPVFTSPAAISRYGLLSVTFRGFREATRLKIESALTLREIW